MANNRGKSGNNNLEGAGRVDRLVGNPRNDILSDLAGDDRLIATWHGLGRNEWLMPHREPKLHRLAFGQCTTVAPIKLLERILLGTPNSSFACANSRLALNS